MADANSFIPVSAADFMLNYGAFGWRVKNVLPLTGLGMMYGPSGSGKTFFIIDLMCSIARGISWRDYKVKQGKVTYVCAEGSLGVKKRLKAYSKFHAFPFDDSVRIIDGIPNLYKDDFDALVAAIKLDGGTDFIVIDTLAQVSSGANENVGEDMAPIFAKCVELARIFDALVILVHHTGKDEARGSRGWSGMKAVLDVEIKVEQNGAKRLATITKQKDGETGEVFVFDLESVDLEFDEDGDMITSCIVQSLEASKPTISLMGNWQKRIYPALQELFDLYEGRSIEHDVLIDSVISSTTHKGKSGSRDSRLDGANRALKTLIKKGIILVDDEGKYVPHVRN